MANIKRANTSGITKTGTAVADVPDAPTIGTPTAGLLSASVPFTAAVTGGTPTSYTVTSSPGSLTGTGASSPITVSGLTGGTSYTFTVTATNSNGTSGASSASSSVTPTDYVGGYYALATATVSSGGADSVTFASIPTGYKHLQIRYIARTTRAETDDGFSIQLNGNTGTNYRYHYLAGGGASASSYTEGSMTGYSVPYVSAANAPTNAFGVGILDLLDYSDTTKNKVVRILGGEDGNNGGWVALNSGVWLSTSAITSIKFQTNNLGDFVQYSQFAIYGVK